VGFVLTVGLFSLVGCHPELVEGWSACFVILSLKKKIGFDKLSLTELWLTSDR